MGKKHGRLDGELNDYEQRKKKKKSCSIKDRKKTSSTVDTKIISFFENKNCFFFSHLRRALSFGDHVLYYYYYYGMKYMWICCNTLLISFMKVKTGEQWIQRNEQ
jgi:hypothetical protein